MNYLNNAKQFWKRRSDYLVPIFWSKVFGILKSNIITKKISQKEFQQNLNRIKSRPFNIHFEVTNVCNARCTFCAYQYMKRQKGFMPQNVFLKAIKDYENIGGGDVHFNVVVGDPLLDPGLIEKIKIARSISNINDISLTTNGIRINSVGARELLTSGINRIYISLAEFDEKIYEEIYRVKRYKDVLSGLLNLLELNEELRRIVDITIGFRSYRPLNKIVKTEDFKKIKKYEPNFDFVWSYDNWVGRIKKEDLSGVMSLRSVPFKKEPCFWLFDGPIIFMNGDVGLCGCRDLEASSELVVGNIMQKDLIDIWNDKRVEEIRKSFYENTNIPKICQECTMYRNLDFFRTGAGSKRAIETEKRLADST